MNELVDEILSDETILLNDALAMIKAELEKTNLDKDLQQEITNDITPDLDHALSNE